MIMELRGSGEGEGCIQLHSHSLGFKEMEYFWHYCVGKLPIDILTLCKYGFATHASIMFGCFEGTFSSMRLETFQFLKRYLMLSFHNIWFSIIKKKDIQEIHVGLFWAISVSSIIVMSGLVTSIRWQCISCMLLTK